MLNLVSSNSVSIQPNLKYHLHYNLQGGGVVVMVRCNHNHNELELTIHGVGLLEIIDEPKTTNMYHMHTYITSTCIHVIRNGEFRFGDCFGYTYFN